MCLCFKTANVITVAQLKQLGKTETMENLIVHKNDNENLLKIVSVNRDIYKLLLEHRTKDGLLLMVEMEWLQTYMTGVTSYAFWANIINKIFKLRSSLPAHLLQWAKGAEVVNGMLPFSSSPCGTFLHRHWWFCSVKHMQGSNIICREWCKRKMCLRLLYQNFWKCRGP